MIGAEEVARSVDQIDAVAARDRFPDGGSFALSDGHDGSNIGIGRPPVSTAAALSPIGEDDNEAEGGSLKVGSRAWTFGWWSPARRPCRGRRRSARYIP